MIQLVPIIDRINNPHTDDSGYPKHGQFQQIPSMKYNIGSKPQPEKNAMHFAHNAYSNADAQ